MLHYSLLRRAALPTAFAVAFSCGLLACKPRKSTATLAAAGGADCGGSMTEEEAKKFEEILNKLARGERLSDEPNIKLKDGRMVSERTFMTEIGLANLDLRIFLATEAVAGRGTTPERSRLSDVARAFALAGITGKEVQEIINSDPLFKDKEAWTSEPGDPRSEAIASGAETMAGENASDAALRERVVRSFASVVRGIPEEAATRVEYFKGLVNDYQNTSDRASLEAKAKEMGFVADILDAALHIELADGKRLIDVLPQNDANFKKIVELGLVELRVKLAIADKGGQPVDRIIGEELANFKNLFSRSPTASALAAEFLLEMAYDSIVDRFDTATFERLQKEARGQVSAVEFAFLSVKQSQRLYELAQNNPDPERAKFLADAAQRSLEIVKTNGRSLSTEVFGNTELSRLIEQSRSADPQVAQNAQVEMAKHNARLAEINKESARRLEIAENARPRPKPHK